MKLIGFFMCKCLSVKRNLLLVFIFGLAYISGCELRLNADIYSSGEKLHGALRTLHDRKQWIEFWEDVGSGKELPVTSTIQLPSDVERVAYQTLRQVIAHDMDRPTDKQYNEAPWIKMIGFLFNSETIYWKAYIDLAHHAHNRDPRVGRYMFKNAYQPKVFDQYSDISQLYVLYYTEQHSEAILLAEEMVNNLKKPLGHREFALVMKLRCKIKLDRDQGCLAVSEVDPDTLETETHKNAMISMQNDCRTSATAEEIMQRSSMKIPGQ